MDQLTAYKILQLAPGSSQEEVRQAYVELSRKFHPEEYPEEFRRIHEAYQTLHVRKAHGRGRRAEESPASYEEKDHVKQTCEGEAGNPESEYRQQNVENPEKIYDRKEQEEVDVGYRDDGYEFEPRSAFEADPLFECKPPKQTYDFDSVIQQAEVQEEKHELRTIEKALLEMEMLLLPENRNKLKSFQRFFQKEEYRFIIGTPEFMGKLAKLLTDIKLKNSIYDYMIDSYRLRGLRPEDLCPEARQLYQLLMQRRGTEKKKRETLLYWLPAIAAVVLRSMFRYRNDAQAVRVLIILLIIFICCVFLYRLFHKNHSNLFAQGMTAFLLMLSQGIILLGEFYRPFLYQDNADVLAVMLLGLGVFWLIIVFIIALVKKIAANIRRHH